MALTDKKRRFVDALLSGATNREAAIAAGYSEKTASQAGSKLAKDPDVLAEVGRRLKQKQASSSEVNARRPMPSVASRRYRCCMTAVRLTSPLKTARA